MTGRKAIVMVALLTIWASLRTDSLPAQALVSRLSGTVVADDGAETPIGGAVVTVASPSLASSRMTLTDGDGRYAFTDLPQGRVTVKASKLPYLTMSYGATRPDRNGVPIPIAAGLSTPDVRIALPLGGVVTGQVVNDDSVPIPNVVVSARRKSLFDERVSEVTTDDRGVYRIYGLPSGDYVIAATVIAGGTGNIVRLAAAEIDRLLAELGRPGGTPANAHDVGAEVQLAFTPVFWPGTSDAEAAGSVKVEAGSEVGGVNITWHPIKAATVRGTVIVADATALSRVRVELLTADRRLPIWGSGPTVSFDRADPTRFVITAVPPGNYQLIARAQKTGGPPGDSDLFAVSELRCDGSDIAGLSLTLRPGSHIQGVVSGATPETLRSFRLRLAPDRIRGSGSSTESPVVTTLKADGTFELDGIPPGRYLIELIGPSTFGGSLRSLVVQGRELIDVPLVEVRAGETLAAVLRLNPERSDLSGVLLRPDQAPAIGFDVVIFPADVDMRRPFSRRVRTARPGTDGVFEFRDLLPGKYLVAAVTDVRPEDLANSDFLSLLASGAAPAEIRASGVFALRLMTVR